MSSIGEGRLPTWPWARGAAFREDAMTELTRRRIVAAAATAALAPLAHAQAAAPLARSQAPGFYRCKVGEFEITVVNTGAKLVLIDTGYGPGLGPTVGLLPSTLAAAGFDPKSIDIVLISHMHGDHILGLKTPDGALAFPNAEIKVPAIDWAFWMNDDNMSRAPEGFTKTSFGFNRKIFSNLADKVTRYEWGREVAPGITAVETSGHTPGHTSFVIASGASQLFFQGDVTNVPDLFLRNPDWQVMFDHEPEKAVATRRRVYDMASADKLLVSGYHFPFPGLGYIEKAGSGYRLIPAAWHPVI